VAPSPQRVAAISIARRTVIQDLLGRHTVFIDGQPRGRLWALQTGRYPVTPGRHRVRLGTHSFITLLQNPIGASSDELDVDVSAGETLALRTRGRGLSGPLSLRGQTRMPWINLELVATRHGPPG
jgi:hypothetical protein